MLYTITYTDKMKSSTQAAYANMWRIYIRPEYKGDLGLLHHEIRHVEQFWKSFGLHGLFYLLSKRYKLWAEVAAYKEQLKWPPATEDVDHYKQHYAEFISTGYGLDISVEDAVKLLS